MAKRGLEALTTVPLFQGLSRRHLQRIRDIGTETEYMSGETIVKQGEDAESFFVIVAGEAKVTIGDRTVNSLMPGDHFGEISLLDGGKRTASVVTQTPVLALRFERSDFMRLMQKEPTMTLVLLRSLARMLRGTQRSLEG
jgi:CRP/FNR family cyclic AMP-dependent transcriptional regulator